MIQSIFGDKNTSRISSLGTMDLLLGGIPYLPLTSPGHCSFSALWWVGVGRILGSCKATETQLRFLVTGWFLGCTSDILFSHSSMFWLVIRSNEQTTNDSSLFLSFSPVPPFRLSLERPMKIEIVVDPSKPLPLASRVAPAPVATNGVQSPAPR